MKNEDRIIKDALQLCLEIIRKFYEDKYGGIMVYISMDETISFLGTKAFTYTEIETPFYLETLGIIKFLPIKDYSAFTPQGKGTYQIYFNYVLAEEWVNKQLNLRLNNLKFEKGDFFYIDANQTLKIFNGVTTISIPFYSKQQSNMFYLIHSFIEYLKNYGELKNGWIEAYVKRSFIREHIKKTFNIDEISNDWIKTTRSHLIDKIPKDFIDKIIKIGYYDKKKEAYYFAIRLPETY